MTRRHDPVSVLQSFPHKIGAARICEIARYQAIGVAEAGADLLVRSFKLHDRLVARALPRLVGRLDVVHAWPLGALETLRTARRLGIPTVLERPNAHTRFAHRAVEEECKRLGVALPAAHEHAFNAAILSSDRLVRHRYGHLVEAYRQVIDEHRGARGARPGATSSAIR
jgi:hypothetical protein